MARYEFSDGKSNKFWEIELNGSAFCVRFGRIGTDGQSQAKNFTTAELAKKEHDRLVAEKVKKGYQLVSGESSPAATPPLTGKTDKLSRSFSLRKDIYVYNEATGMLATSRRMAGKGWDSNGKEWEKAVRAGDLIPMELYQDDPFTIRVVVGGQLDVQESEEWVGRLDWKLRVTDGNLVICGGSEYVMEEFEDPAEFSLSDYVREVKIPRGDYRVTMYMYMGGVNGRPCLTAARGGDELDPLGEWFRRTRPNEKFPAWLHNDCVLDPDEDPGHESEWKIAEKITDPVEHYVEFLLHLEPLEKAEKIDMPELGDGWFSTPTRCRVPERIPLGIAAKDVDGLPKKPDPNIRYPLDVFKDTQKFKRVPLKDGAAEVPLKKFERLFRIPWFCHSWAMPQIRVHMPKGSVFPDSEPVEHVVFSRDGDVLNFGFEPSGSQSGSIRQVAEVARRIGELPNGARIEMDTAFIGSSFMKKEKPFGLHRYCGIVKNGNFIIEETFPPVHAQNLKRALELSAQLEGGTSIDTGSEVLAAAVVSALKTHAYFGDNPVVASGKTGVSLKNSEPNMLNFVAAAIFKQQFQDVFPVFDIDAEDEDDEKEELSAAAKGPTKPPRSELIFSGDKQRGYFLTDSREMDEPVRKKLVELEREIMPLGFKYVGEIVCSALDHMLIRGYANEGRTAWAAVMLMSHGGGTFEFISYFDKGASLTTTRNMMVRDELFRDVFRTVRPAAKMAEMLKEHDSRAAHLSEFYGPPLKIDSTPKGLASDVEGSLKRQEEVAAGKTKMPLLEGAEGRKHFQFDGRVIHATAPQAIADADKLMKEMGLTVIGDVVSTFFTSYVYRGYLEPGGDTLAKFVLEGSSAPTVNGSWEFTTRFENGGTLVSTRSAMSKDEPKRKLYRIIDPKAGPKEMLEKHSKRKVELIKKCGAPVKLTASMKTLAEEAEAVVERVIG